MGRASGTRATRQRAAVAELLLSVDDFRSAQQLHDLLRHDGQNVGLATVYRALQAMAAAGDIDVILASNGQSLYRRCGQGTGHHHHLVCRVCGLTIEVDGPAVERWTHKVGVDNGFVDVSHTLDIFGLCRTCAARAPSPLP
ncbi:MAG: Fur family transcriptional regulator [Actinobacteria bacterium]|nr:Fur family transcriptional regulator [Actinomycetota bacterium]